MLAFWRDECLVAGGRPVRLAGTARETISLGADVFVADLSGVDEDVALLEAGADAAVDVRLLPPGPEAATLEYALSMLHWARSRRFCGTCGGRTSAEHAGLVRRCQGCGKGYFPHVGPHVVVLVESPDRRRCLLVRYRGGDAPLDGVVEIGESLEDAVRRELREEAGMRVRDISYQASRTRQFPFKLMVGFRAVTEDVAVDRHGLSWFTRDEVRALAHDRRDSIGSYLLETWLDEIG